MKFKRLIQKIPNLLSLVNLFLGAVASILILQSADLVQANDMVKYTFEVKPTATDLGGLIQASLLVLLAAFIDFFDGFLARYLKAESPVGQQLDSLSDMITFGLVPGLMLYMLIGEAYRLDTEALSTSRYPFYFGLLVTLFSAVRLAKFNVAKEKAGSFRGLPTPAAAMLVASLPLLLLINEWGLRTIIMNRFVLFGFVIVVSYLLTSNQTMFSLKFKNLRWQGNEIRYLFVFFIPFAAIVCSLFSSIYLAMPVIVVTYIILSLLFNLFNYEV